MNIENDVNNQTEQVKPSPATLETDATISGSGAVAVPAESPAVVQNNKQTSAFIKMRQELRDLKHKQAMATPANVPTPILETEQAQTATVVIPPTPAPVMAVVGIAEIEKQAIKELSEDKVLAKVPGGLMEVLALIDNDPRLSRLYNEIDPALAIREAKNIYFSQAGIAPAPALPKSSTPSGGMGTNSTNLESMLNEIDTCQPGTKQFADLATKITAEMKKR